MIKDKVFQKEIEKQFEFNEDVAEVFDDMLNRSVPFYQEAMQVTLFFIKNYSNDEDIIYDLGSSTGTLLINIAQDINKNLKLIGIDNSEAMVKRARTKSKIYKLKIDFFKKDILETEFKKAKIFISSYTLQFIRPINRLNLIKKIYNSLDDNGIFICSEKVIFEDKKINKIVIDEYYKFKKQQGYSELEITRKREALENVLIPYTQEENILLFKQAGFKTVDVVFKWLNFTTFIAKK